MKDLKTTNILLLTLVVPVIFYLLNILSFIFIPLTFAMFISLLFLPLMRNLTKRKVPKFISIIISLLIIAAVFKIGGTLIQLSSKEIISAQDTYVEKAEEKILLLVASVNNFFGISQMSEASSLEDLIPKDKLMSNFGSTMDFLSRTLSMTLMTAFFVVLLLAESVDIQKVLNTTILKRKFSSIRIFMRIERDLLTFMKVKFIISFFTGVGFSLACLGFGVSFPIFWGLFAFIINFVQMIGSIIAVILLAIFALVELDPSSVWFFFLLSITGVQVLFGSILEPVFMGKSFSINVVSILVMLMFWGFIWGIPGMIMAIPITVFLKILFEQFDNTKVIADLLSGSDGGIGLPKRKKK